MNVIFENSSYFDVGFTQDSSFEVDLGYVRPAEEYTGDYEVTPKAHNRTVLPTEGKIMMGDVTVLKVPYYETSNIHDGLTVFIAEDLNG